MDKPNAVFIPPNYNVRVLADRVRIVGNRGSLALPSASLEIVARKLECDFPGCVIDLSGPDAPTDATSDQAKSGAQQGWPATGTPGTDGAWEWASSGQRLWALDSEPAGLGRLQGRTARTAARVAS